MAKRHHKDGMIDGETPVEKHDASLLSSIIFWLLCLCLGLSLAAHESSQYTALWDFETKTLAETIVACVVVLIVGAVLIALGRRNGLDWTFCLRAFFVLMCVQFVAILMQIGLDGSASSPILAYARIVFQEMSFFALPLLWPIAHALRVRNVTQLYMGGFAIAGAIQVFACLLIRSAAMIFVAILPLAALAVLFIALRLGSTEDATRESAYELSTSSEGLLPVLACAAILIFAALLIDTNEARMVLQDGGSGSRMLQMVAGASSLAAAIALFAADRRFMSEVTICLCCFFALPVMLGALYASSISSFTGSAFLVAILHRFGYAIMFYLMTCFFRLFSSGIPPQMYILICFFVTRIGWALGLLIFPRSINAAFDVLAPICGALVLGAICAVVVVRMAKKWAFGRVNASPVEIDANSGSEGNPTGFIADAAAPTGIASVDVLQKVSIAMAEKYGLTPRELDVFVLLARGRTAAYIQKTLCISDGTTRTHMNHIYRKLGINSHEELMDLVDASIESFAAKES